MIRVPLSDKYQLDRLLLPQTDPRTEKFKPGFETVAACIAEDQLHARSLWETAARIRKISTGIWPLSAGAVALKNLNIDPDAALNLANPCGGRNRRRVPQPTLASALFMRGQSLHSGGELMELIDKNQRLEFQDISEIYSSLGIPAAPLLEVDARQIQGQFRTYLKRAGIAQMAGFPWKACTAEGSYGVERAPEGFMSTRIRLLHWGD